MKEHVFFMLHMIAAVLKNSTLPPEPEGVTLDWERIYSIAKRQQLSHLVAYGALSGAYALPESVRAKFFQDMKKGVLISENQDAEFGALYEKLDQAGLPYLPLKGSVLKDYYPSRDMRLMSDADLLIRKERKEEYRKVMEQAGFTFTQESNHEINYHKKPLYVAELHKYLIPTYSRDMYQYYETGWNLAKPCENGGSRYRLSDEDCFVYLLSHFSKHYRSTGAGLKYVIDFWVMKRACPNMDMDYIQTQLERLHIKTFSNHVLRLTEWWFEDGTPDEISDEMTRFMIDSGVFGTVKNQQSTVAIRKYQHGNVEQATHFRLVKQLFPSLTAMKKVYPVLNKAPVLLPFLWLVRIGNTLLFRRGQIQESRTKAESVDVEYIKLYREHMEAVGIDIYNGRDDWADTM